jgi:hypothetical protein
MIASYVTSVDLASPATNYHFSDGNGRAKTPCDGFLGSVHT